MLGYSFLFVRETNKFFRAQFQTYTCLETTRSACIPKHYCSKNYFFSLSITLKTRYELPKSFLKHTHMIQEVSRLFKTLTFIFIEFSDPATTMQV